MQQYAIAAAKNQLSRLVQQVERGEAIELTRRGKAVAVVLSEAEYQRLQRRPSFSEALRAFRARAGFTGLSDAEMDEIFGDVRAKDTGREVEG
jgi:prevent-host-death family protein